ncbi:hypothetical protein [Vibrio atypicus]|uniref:hypothetical protein n=1 Tax=Vibrio atypicus TaxID=558271 RepID=UPI001CEC8133|nr:hypothetical protein [Vibrio atypicus]
MTNRTIELTIRSVLFVGALSGSFASQAFDYSVSGFGTLGYTYNSESDLAYRRDITHPVEKDSQGSFGIDSNLGLQFDGNFNRQWSATVQLLLDKSVEYNLDTLTEFAFVRYSPNASWDFRAGRVGVSAYAAANSRHIDYAHLWVRPPQELYGGVVFNSLDGIGATYYSNNPNFNWQATIEYGRNQQMGEIPISSEEYSTDIENVFSLSLEADKGPWKWQVSYAHIGSLTVDHGEGVTALQQGIEGLANNTLLASFFPNIVADANLASELVTVKDDQVSYFQGAVNYFDGSWTLQSELFQINAKKDSVPQGYGGYALLGRTFSNFTPYVMYGRFKPTTDYYQSDQDWSSIGALAGAQAGEQARQLQHGAGAAINSVRIDQASYSIGVRWDVSSQIAIKAQIDHVTINPYGYGLWASSVEDISQSMDVQVYTLNMNFIF